jgi:hypothetical protein
MGLNKKTRLIILLLLPISIMGFGQQLETGINVYPSLAHSQGFEPGMNGNSLNLDYLHKMGEKTSLKGGLELGYTGWGGQGLISTGLRYGEISALDAEILNGLAFYQQGPRYVFGTGVYYSRSFFTEGKNRLLISLGLRYTIQAGYKEFSPLYAYIDIPLRIRWSRKL